MASSRRSATRRPTLEEAFGRVLRELREEAGLSQERLGHEVESGRTYVSQLERGERGPSLKMVIRLAPRLGTTAADFVARVEALLS